MYRNVKICVAFASLIGLVGLAAGPAQAQTTKPVQGAVQMPGDNGKLGVKYQLGAKGTEMHFTLNTAMVATRYKALDANIVAGKNERLLVLNFTIANPLKIEQNADSRSFKITVVSPDDKNVEFSGSVFEPVKRTSISQSLKQAQKVTLEAAIPIFAKGPITKIIVARGNGTVLRYDLRNSLTKSTSVFATDGISIEDEATVTLGKAFDFGAYDMEIQEMGELSEALGGYVPSASSGVYFVTVKFSNPLSKPISVGWQYFRPMLTDENGEEIHWPSDMVSVSSGKTLTQEVEPNGSIRARYMFTGAKGLKLAKFKLTNNDSGRSVTIKAQG